VFFVYRHCTQQQQQTEKLLAPLKRYCEYACAVLGDQIQKLDEYAQLDAAVKKNIDAWRENGTKLRSYMYTYCKEMEMVMFTKEPVSIVRVAANLI